MMAAEATSSVPGLHSLLHDMVDIAGVADLPVNGIATDSREVRPGYLFLARVFRESNAIGYINDAIQAGAVAVVAETDYVEADEIATVPILAVSDLQAKAGTIAARFYNNPSESLRIIGITGTNGKSSTCHIVAQAINGIEGRACGVIGTLGYGTLDTLHTGPNTTPEPVPLQKLLFDMRSAGRENVVMEVSSHGIEQHRIDGTRFAAAVFTNLSQDHLDYHTDMPAYAAVKKRLFTDYDIGTAVINADDAIGRELITETGARKIVYALEPGVTIDDLPGVALVSGEILEQTPSGMTLRIKTPEGEGVMNTSLVGRFNASNLLAGFAVLTDLGYSLPDILDQLTKTRPVPGRMEHFGNDQTPQVYVDYAHTPDALEQVLQTLKPHCAGQLICVFGCGGDRDRDKRARMGRIAALYADRIILTSDNPRHEDPFAIIRDIAAGIEAFNDLSQISDREQAIHAAIKAASHEDIVLIAGKGHETWQETAGVRRSFSDQTVVAAALGRLP